MGWRRRCFISTVAVTLAMLAACAPSSHIVVGKIRAPLPPEQVRVYLQPPRQFDEIAALDASSKSMFGTGGQKSVDTVILRLKTEAGKLGANGIILEGFRDAQTGSIGTGVGSDSYSRSSAVGVGVGGSLGIYTKTGHATAIYVDPAMVPPPGSVPPGGAPPDAIPPNAPPPDGQPPASPQPT